MYSKLSNLEIEVEKVRISNFSTVHVTMHVGNCKFLSIIKYISSNEVLSMTVKVYRFYDMGKYVYFTSCQGEVIVANNSMSISNTTSLKDRTGYRN